MKYSAYRRFAFYTPRGRLPEGKKYIRDFRAAGCRSRKRTSLARFLAMLAILAEIMLAGVVSGCSGSGQQNSSSASSFESESVSGTAPVSMAKEAAPVSSQSSASPQSENEYALPASSEGSSVSQGAHPATQSAAPPDSSTESVPQPANGTASQSVFQSVFGQESAAESGSQQLDKSGPKISMEEYDKIQEGMTYETAKSIIGSAGKIDWASGVKGSDMYTERYRWDGSGSSGSYALLTFEGGKLDMKIQFGLE